MYDWVEGDMKWELEHASSLSEVIEIVHSDWSPQQKADLRNFLTASQIGVTGYRDNWMDYDDQYSSYAQQRDQATAEQAANTSKYTGQGWTQGPDSEWYPPGTLDSTSNAITPYQQAGIDQENAQFAWQQQQAQQQAAWQQQQLAYQRQQDAQAAAYQQQQLAMEKAANTWTRYTDASGVWQKNQLGEVQRVGDVPQGVVQNLPETWAGWGKQWQQNQQYNPTSQAMDTIYGAAPLGYQEALAQGQWANQPGSWYDVALLNRTLNPTEQKYQTQVGNTVGALVSNRQGYDPRYDLQSGQAATGVTPGGWYDTSQNSNAWQQGYPQSVGGTGNGEVGGYQTQIMNYGDYQNNPTGQAELSGWLNSGFADYTEDEYLAKQNRLRAPQRYQGVSWR